MGKTGLVARTVGLLMLAAVGIAACARPSATAGTSSERPGHPVVAGLEQQLANMVGDDPELQSYLPQALRAERLAQDSAEPPTQLTDLASLDDFQAAFNSDQGTVRLVLLLSPT